MNDTCDNCGCAPATATVCGYDVCPDCEIRAALPWHLRDSA
jgi:hypothetical protein